MHATAPWDADDALCPFIPEMVRIRDRQREKDYRFSEHRICAHPDCQAWIENHSKTCKEHRSWYDLNIRFPAMRLVKLIREAQDQDLGACPAIVLGCVRGIEIGVIAPELERVLKDA